MLFNFRMHIRPPGNEACSRNIIMERAWDEADQDALMSQLSDAVLRSEGADPNDPAAHALVWACYSERPAGKVYVGGKNIEKAP